MKPEFDLVVLVPDADWEQTISALLRTRCRSLGIRGVTYKLVRHSDHDPGVRTKAASLLRLYVRRAAYALVCLDHAGSGHPGNAQQLEEKISADLAEEWAGRSAVVVAEPELEAWVWSGSSHVGSTLGWKSPPVLREHLENIGAWPPGTSKPPDPKDAMQKSMRQTGKRSSAAIFAELAEKVSLSGCQDQAFGRLLEALTAWFPAAPP